MGLPKVTENTTQEAEGGSEENTQEGLEENNTDSTVEASTEQVPTEPKSTGPSEEELAAQVAEEEAKEKRKRSAEKSAATKKANKEKKLAEAIASGTGDVCEFGYASSTRFRYVDPGTGEVYHRAGSGLKPTLPRVENSWLKAQLKAKIIVRLEKPLRDEEE